MADKTDDLIISISTDTATIRRSLKKLEGDIAAASGNIVKKFDAMGKGIDNSMTTAMQARIDQMVGIGTKAAKQWNGVLAEQGAEMEKLRARYNPIFAAVKQYQSSVVGIQQAHRIGAISADEMTTAIQRERKATLDSIAAIKQRNSAVSSMQSGPRGFQTANIAAQFQDIAVTSAMGMSPIQIALQQGTQLSAVFNEMGKGKDVIRGIGAAFASIVSPVSLVTIGVIAASAALLQYVSSANSVKSIDEILEENRKKIDEVTAGYKEAKAAHDAFVQGRSIQTSGDSRADLDTQIKSLTKEYEAAQQRIVSFQETIRGFGRASLSVEIIAQSKALSDLAKSAGEANADLSGISSSLKTMTAEGFAHQNLTDWAAEIQKAVDGAIKLKSEIGGMEVAKSQINAVTEATARLEAAINSISSEKARQELIALMEKAKSGEKSAADLQTAFNKLSGTYPDLSSARQELTDLIAKFGEAQAAAAGFAKTTAKGDLGWDLPKPLSSGDFDRRTSGQDTLKKQLEDQAKTFAPKKERRSSAERQAERDANAYRDLVKTARDRIDQLKLEEQLTGKTGVAAEAMRMKLELLQKAQDKGRTVSAGQRIEIEKLATEYGKAAEKVSALALAEELRFERDQMFRSPAEQRVQSTLRSAGIDPEGDYGKLLAGQIRLNEALAEAKDLTLDFAQGFTQDLMNGVSAMDALANAAVRLGQQLISIAANALINDLFKNLLGTGLGGLSGGGRDPWSGLRIPGFAKGTNSAPGGLAMVGENGPELLNIPKGAQVIPNDILRSMSNRSISGPRVPSIPQGGAANQNVRVTSDVRVSVDDNGNMRAFVRSQAAEVSEAQITGYDRELLPRRFRQIAQDPYAVG